MTLASSNCFIVPIEIALNPPITQNWFYKLITILTDLIFMVDIAINFNSTYESGDGTVIYDRKLIAKNYLKTRFAIDFLSAIPIDLMASSVSDSSKNKRFFKLFSLLKLFRMLRLAKLIRALNQAREAKVRLKIIKVLI